MPEEVKQFTDGSRLEFDWGSFDPWCVYMVSQPGKRRALRHADLFADASYLAGKYGLGLFYEQHFVYLYDQTTKDWSIPAAKRLLDDITNFAVHYGPADCMRADKTLTGLYATMVAEESKENTSSASASSASACTKSYTRESRHRRLLASSEE